MAPPSNTPVVLTQSELSAFTRCRRKWWLGWYRGLRKQRYSGSSPLTIGNLVHYGLAEWYGHPNAPDPIEIIKRRSLEMLERYPEAGDDILACAELSGIMLEGYLEWLEATGADADLDVYAAEEKVEVPLLSQRERAEGAPARYVLRGKMDGRAIRKTDGFHAQLEHKTAQNLADVPKTAQFNFQFLTYDLLAYLAALEDPEHLVRTDGLILNILRKVKRTSRANPPFYGRHDVRHNTAELRAHWHHVLAIAQAMDRARERLDAGESHQDVVPPTPTKNCSWDCDFYAVCSMFDDGSAVEMSLEANYETHDPLARYEEEEDAS